MYPDTGAEISDTMDSLKNLLHDLMDFKLPSDSENESDEDVEDEDFLPKKNEIFGDACSDEEIDLEEENDGLIDEPCIDPTELNKQSPKSGRQPK